MAHNLNYNPQNKQHSFFTVKEKAWHGLGQLIQDYPTSGEALQFAGLDYSVEKRPLFTLGNSDVDLIGNGHESLTADISVPNSYATLRTDTQDVLGVVGKDYQIVQNIEAFSFFDNIVGNGSGIQYETAGALGKGERIFITAKLPDFIRVGREDLIEQYIFLTTSHDGYGSISAAFTPVRIVCQNTLNAAFRAQSNSIKIRHTANATDRLKQAHRLMGISNQLSTDLESIYNQWAKISINDQELKKLIALAMAPGKEVTNLLREEKTEQLSTHFNNIINDVFNYALSAPSQQQDTTRGTVFGAYNAVTGYFQNVRKFSDVENKLKSILFGTGLQRAQVAFNLCEEFTKHGKLTLN